MSLAVSLDQPLAFGDLDREVIIGGAVADAREPGIDAHLLDAVAQRSAPPSPQSREAVQREKPAELRGIHVAPAPEQGREQARRAAACDQPPPDRRGQRLAQLLKARVHEFGDVDDLLRAPRGPRRESARNGCGGS